MPLLNIAEEKFRARNDVVFIKVSIDTNETLWKKAVEKNGIKGVLLIDQDQKLMKAFQIDGIPSMVIVGRDGVVVKRNVTPHDGNLEAEIVSLL